MAFLGNEERERTEGAVRRHFFLIENLADLQAHLLDAETGLRGNLLAHKAEFLAPYELATRFLPRELDSLQQLVEGEPGAIPRRQKLVRLRQIRTTVLREMTLLDRLRAFSGAGAALDAQLVESKTTMDRLRVQVREMRDREEQLLGERLADIRRVRRRDYFTIAAVLLLGLLTRGVVFWLFNRRIARGVRQLIENVRRLRAGQPLSHSPSGALDDLGQLERAVAELAPNETSR